MFIVLALTAGLAEANPLPMAIQGSYCDFYTGGCESPERYIARPDGTVAHSFELYGMWSTPTTWGTWSWEPIGDQLELLNDNALGFPFKLVVSPGNVTVYEDAGSFIMVSDVYDFEVDRVFR